MAKHFKTLFSVAVASLAVFGARSAMAASAVHGVAFIHGTGDNIGSQVCSGTGTSFKCVVQKAIDGYWGQGEITSVSGGRPYVVTGQHGGTMTPWTNPSPYINSGGETTNGTAYEVASQINRFLAGPDGVYGNADDITDLVVVSHSGGSNVIRYIVQHPTINTNFTHVAGRLRKIIAVAPPSKGTYLANKVFNPEGAIMSLVSGLAGLAGYKDDGVKFIQTTEMSSSNADSAKFVNMSATQGGVPFYNSGGVSDAAKCKGVTVFGKCIGVMWSSLGPSYCDSTVESIALSTLHNTFLYANDAGTARNNCSDGFISCASAQAIGTSFGYDHNQDHNQSRKQCNGEDGKIAAQVANAMTGFENEAVNASVVPVAQWDSCGFAKYASVWNGSTKIGYTAGCAKGDLGDGWCDWDCVAMYGHDAVATWDSTGKLVTAWGAADDCANPSATVNATYGGVVSTNNPWADYQTYSNDNVNWYYTQFTGKSNGASSTVYYTDPLAGTASAVGYCPQSWIGDGVCDECVLANYGSDGLDCAPGRISQCGGIIAKNDTLTVTNNPIYNEGDPTTGGTTWYFWNTLSSAAVGNGVCDIGECTRNNWNPCAVDTDCMTGTCSGGYCSTSASTCNTTADCLSGSCVNGGCTTAGADCSATISGAAVSLCR
ncbi:MAG: hypothetical protein ACXVEF_33180 [Polyangiales bacterium]